MTEFEEWRVEMACKLIRQCQERLKCVLDDGERRELLFLRTHWTGRQIEDVVSAIRLNGGSVEESE